MRDGREFSLFHHLDDKVLACRKEQVVSCVVEMGGVVCSLEIFLSELRVAHLDYALFAEVV